MNENAKKWVEALRSGEYTQARNVLRFENRHCCLGVACDLYSQSEGVEWEVVGNGHLEFMGHSADLPDPVKEWVGLASRNGCRMLAGKAVGKETLAGKNDGGETFMQIAKYIESEPVGLFIED